MSTQARQPKAATKLAITRERRGMPKPEALVAPAASPQEVKVAIQAVSQIEQCDPFLTYPIFNNLGGPGTGTDETTSQRSAVQKSDFRILKTIGRGTYGKVYLVQHLQTEQIFAMKSVQKEMLIRTDQVAGIRGKQLVYIIQSNSNVFVNMRE